MQPVHVNFQVCAKVHEEDESPWLQGQECLWCAPDSSRPENRAAPSPEHTASPALPTEQLSRPGRSFTPWTCSFFLKSPFKQAAVSIFVPGLFEDYYLSCWASVSSGDLIVGAKTKSFPLWDLYPANLLKFCSYNSPADLYTTVYFKEHFEILMYIEWNLERDQDSPLLHKSVLLMLDCCHWGLTAFTISQDMVQKVLFT